MSKSARTCPTVKPQAGTACASADESCNYLDAKRGACEINECRCTNGAYACDGAIF